MFLMWEWGSDRLDSIRITVFWNGNSNQATTKIWIPMIKSHTGNSDKIEHRRHNGTQFSVFFHSFSVDWKRHGKANTITKKIISFFFIFICLLMLLLLLLPMMMRSIMFDAQWMSVIKYSRQKNEHTNSNHSLGRMIEKQKERRKGKKNLWLKE